MTPLLSVQNLTAAFSGVKVLHGIDMELAPGTLTAVVGANGAGKTTLLRAISGLLAKPGGQVDFDGRNLIGVAPHLIAQSGLVHVPQGRQIVPGLTVEENLRIGATSLPDVNAAEIARRLEVEYARFPVLAARRGIPGTALSGGEQQMLAVSRALMMKPRLLMLDEPSLGLAPQIVAQIHGALRQLAGGGMTVLLVEQAAFAALRIAGKGYVLQNGRIALSGEPSQLLVDADLISKYLG